MLWTWGFTNHPYSPSGVAGGSHLKSPTLSHKTLLISGCVLLRRRAALHGDRGEVPWRVLGFGSKGVRDGTDFLDRRSASK